ncbi:unnamed protein product [Leptosia nina]|uniref:Uncharacterized protein n=1 Tax=Leptosia nina TaxID=320188 RepID=A0AAV1JYS6_9NEOP
MADTKFFVYGGGRWREINLERGNVDGWRHTRFVYVKNGKLAFANKRAVLRGLRDLVQNKPSTVQYGLPLPRKKIKEFKRSHAKSNVSNHHCCGHQNSCCNSVQKTQYQPATTTNTAVQCDIEAPKKQSQRNVKQRAETHIVRETNHDDIQVSSDEASTSSSVEPSSAISLRNRGHTLEINENDILLFRNFIENDGCNMLNVDLLLFDEDDREKEKALYKINPVVRLVRDKRIIDLIKLKRRQIKGLTTHKELNSVEISTTPKENIKGTKVQRKKQVKSNPQGIRTHVSSSNAVRVYSLLEDEAIVAWMLKSDRATQVKGNRLWREYAQHHSGLTGQGEIGKKKSPKNNSIYKINPVRSAWSSRPLQELRDKDEEPQTPRQLRSNVATAPRVEIPTYSEITRRFAERHQSTPYTEEDTLETSKEQETDNTRSATTRSRSQHLNGETKRSLKRNRVDSDTETNERKLRKTKPNKSLENTGVPRKTETPSKPTDRQSVRNTSNRDRDMRRKSMNEKRKEILAKKDEEQPSYRGNERSLRSNKEDNSIRNRTRTKRSATESDSDFQKKKETRQSTRQSTQRAQKNGHGGSTVISDDSTSGNDSNASTVESDSSSSTAESVTTKPKTRLSVKSEKSGSIRKFQRNNVESVDWRTRSSRNNIVFEISDSSDNEVGVRKTRRLYNPSAYVSKRR